MNDLQAEKIIELLTEIRDEIQAVKVLNLEMSENVSSILLWMPEDSTRAQQ